MLVFWITNFLFIPFIACDESLILASEGHLVGVRDMLREAEESIEALRKYKENREKAEWENNPLAPLAEEIARDSFIVELQPKTDQMYGNITEFAKELKFRPADYNCGKDFDIFKLMDQVMASRRGTTEPPKCIEDLIYGVTTCASASTIASTTGGAVPQTTPASSKPPATAKQKSLKKVESGRKIPEALAKVNSTSTGKIQKLPDHPQNKNLQPSDPNMKVSNKVFQQTKASAPPAQTAKANPTQAHQPPQTSNKVIGAEGKTKPLQTLPVAKQPLASPSEEEDTQTMAIVDDQDSLGQDSEYEDPDSGIKIEKHDALIKPKIDDGSENNDILSPVEYVYDK